MAYCFTLSNGMPGYMPNSIQGYRAETIEEALRIVRDEVDTFCGDDPEATDNGWRSWVRAARRNPDASMWSWDLAHSGAEVLTVSGLTEDEYATQWDGDE